PDSIPPVPADRMGQPPAGRGHRVPEGREQGSPRATRRKATSLHGRAASPVRSLYSSALILLRFFTSVLALAQPGGSGRGIEENARSSPRAEPEPGRRDQLEVPLGRFPGSRR